MTRIFTTPLATSLCVVAASLAFAPAPVFAQTYQADKTPVRLLYTGADAGVSSSRDVATADDKSASYGSTLVRPISPVRHSMRPFSDAAVSFKVGTAGIGFDVATPLAQRLNLRSGASFFSYNTSFTTDGLNIDGGLQFQNASVSLDLYPFANSFRISPGLTFHNNNSMNAKLFVPGGQNFSLGDGDYTSDPADPIHGTAAFAFGNNLAPRITMGFGNMIPRKGGRFSVPVEFGFQYIAQPTVALAISGSSCGAGTQNGITGVGCGSVQQSDVQQEQSDLQSDLSPLRFYPIASIGISYRLGHSRRTE